MRIMHLSRWYNVLKFALFLALPASAVATATATEPFARHGQDPWNFTNSLMTIGMRGSVTELTRDPVFAQALIRTLTAQNDAVGGLSLRGTITASLQNDLRLRAALHDASAAEFGVWRSFGLFLPKITLNASISRDHDVSSLTSKTGTNRIASINLAVPLFTSGRNVSLLSSARNTALAKNYEYLSQERQAAFQAVQVYLGLYLNRVSLAAVERNVKKVRNVARGEAALYDAGMSDMGSRDLARARLAQVEQVRFEAKEAVRQSEIDYTSITGSPVPSRVRLPNITHLVPHDIEGAVVAARGYHPEVLATRYASHAARDQATAKLGEYLPQINLTGQYTRDFGYDGAAEEPDEWNIGVNLSIKLFDAEGLPSVQAARYQSQASRYRALDARRSVEHEVRSAWNAYHMAGKSLGAAKRRSKNLNTRAYGVSQKYDAGFVPVFELFDAQVEAVNAEISLAQLRVARVLAGFRLGFASNTVSADQLNF